MRILVIVDCHVTVDPILRTVHQLVSGMPDSTIALFHPEPDIDPDFQSPDEGIPGPEDLNCFRQEISSRTAALRRSCHAWAEEAGLKDCVHWIERSGNIGDMVTEEARASGLTVVGRPAAADSEQTRRIFEAVLYGARSAVLLVSSNFSETVGRHPVVAWPPIGLEDAGLDLALQAGRQLLENAESVTFLIGERPGENVDDPSLADRLRNQGVTIRIIRFVPGDEDVGKEIRRQVVAAKGDLLVMGAYSHNRFREWLCGGVTRDIFAYTRIPVLTHH